MKNSFVLFIICLGFLNSAIAQGQYAEFSFDKKYHKFKPVNEGEVLKYDFYFTNTGDIPLIISNYKVACSCTKVVFPKEPILPGQTGVVQTTFDTNGKIGWQYRSIKLFANIPKEVFELELRVKVINK